MKPDSNKKIIQLLSVEILQQIGFEKSTEQALNIITDIFTYFFESLIEKCCPFAGCDPSVVIRFLVDDTYSTEQYQIKELLNFIDQQILIKNQLKEKYDIDCDESILHSLRILPKGVSLKSAFKNTKTMTLEEKKSLEIYHEIHLDDFMVEFIEKSGDVPSKRTVESYSFDCSNILEKINTSESNSQKIGFETSSLAPKGRIFGYFDDVLAEQELFIEDFNGIEKHRILR